MISLTTRRSRRLRKKLHVGEFQELGFDVHFEFRTQPGNGSPPAFGDAFIVEAIEGNGLSFGGGENEGFVTARRGSVTQSQRQAVESWLRARPEVKSVHVGPLADAWHGQK